MNKIIASILMAVLSLEMQVPNRKTISIKSDSNESNLQALNNPVGGFIDIKDYYETNRFNLSYIYNSDLCSYSNINAVGANVNKSYKDNEILLSVDLKSKNSKIDIYSTFEDNQILDTIYFYECDGLYFTSRVSDKQAQREALFYQYENDLISEEEYLLNSYQLIKDGINSSYEYKIMDSSLNQVNMDITLNWVDDDKNEHSLDNTKVEIIKRVYFGNDIDYPYYDTVIETLYTNSQGKINYSFASSNDSLYGYYFKAYAASNNTKIVDNNNEEYYYISEIANQVPTGAKMYYNIDFTMDSDIGKAFQMAQAINYVSKYAGYLTGCGTMPFCTLHYGDQGAYYDRNNNIYIKATPSTSSHPAAYADWDVIGHEYGHHVQDIYKAIGDNPGGTHYVNTSNMETQLSNGYSKESAKSRGARLSWAEGWATYFGQMFQQHFKNELTNIKYVNDDYYTAANGVKHSLLTRGYYSPHGEADEICIAQILYQLDDERKNGSDIFSYSDIELYNLAKVNETKSFSAYYSALYNYVSNKEALSKFLGEFKITPVDVKLMSFAAINLPATITWNEDNGSTNFKYNDYKIYIYTPREGLVHIGNSSTNKYTVPNDIWQKIVSSNNSTYSVKISASENTYYATGPYYSQTYVFNNPNISVDTILMRPSSYGFPESYGGLRNTITSSHRYGTHNLEITRLRCGYIEDEYVNISPRKQGAGEAFIQYKLDKNIYRADISLSLWSASESLNSSDSTAQIEYLDANGRWVSAYNLLDGSLPTNRNKQKIYEIAFPNGTTTFRVRATSSSVGTKNKGRISIGNVILYCEEV